MVPLVLPDPPWCLWNNCCPCYFHQISHGAREESMRRAFRRFDADDNGYIELDELKAALARTHSR